MRRIFLRLLLIQRKPLKQKGTWELNNDFMSGPFINYAIIDTIQSHFSFRGFVMPLQRRDLMHELESIIKSVEVPKKIVFIFFLCSLKKNKKRTMVHWKIKAFDALTVHELYDVLQLEVRSLW
jgi:hypothetical protein